MLAAQTEPATAAAQLCAAAGEGRTAFYRLPYCVQLNRVLMNGPPRTKAQLGLDQMGLLRIAD
eukprot:1816930-Prymnesium_polylepis.1